MLRPLIPALLLALLVAGCGGGGGGSNGGGAPGAVPLTDLSPKSFTIISASAPVVSLKTTVGSEVRLNGTLLKGTGGAFSASIPLNLGVNQLDLTITTPQGHRRQQLYQLDRHLPLVFEAKSLIDGRRHAFYHDPGGGDHQLGALTLSAFVDGEPDLHPNGTEVIATRRLGTRWWLTRFTLPDAYAGEEVGTSVYGPDDTADFLAAPRYSPDGGTILFARGSGGTTAWWELDLATGQSTEVFAPALGVQHLTYDATGQWFYYFKSSGGAAALWRVGRSGGFTPTQVRAYGGSAEALCALGGGFAAIFLTTTQGTPQDPPVSTRRVSLLPAPDFKEVFLDDTTTDAPLAMHCHTTEGALFPVRLPYKEFANAVSTVIPGGAATTFRYLVNLPVGEDFEEVTGFNF